MLAVADMAPTDGDDPPVVVDSATEDVVGPELVIVDPAPAVVVPDAVGVPLLPVAAVSVPAVVLFEHAVVEAAVSVVGWPVSVVVSGLADVAAVVWAPSVEVDADGSPALAMFSLHRSVSHLSPDV